MSKKNLIVLFGGKSTEHEISIITALQAIENLDRTKYDITPIYVSKFGKWILGDSSFFSPNKYKDLALIESKYPSVSITLGDVGRLSKNLFQTLKHADVIFPIFHGTNGEDGSTQGLLELLNIPYVGCGVISSALGMDKIIQKQIFTQIGLPQVKYQWFYRQTWKANPKKTLAQLSKLKYPLYVKPCNGGSSVGISRVAKISKLKVALEVAAYYDRKILVEESAENFMEINISVMGNSGSALETSVCEYVPSKGLLTYEDKYMSKGSKTDLKNAGMASGKHIIPASIKPATAKKISDYAKQAFSAIDGQGFTRADFLVSLDEKTIYINELNTIPGSLAHFLWTASGYTHSQFLDKLVELAENRHKEKSQLTFNFNTNILSNLGSITQGKLKV